MFISLKFVTLAITVILPAEVIQLLLRNRNVRSIDFCVLELVLYPNSGYNLLGMFWMYAIVVHKLKMPLAVRTNEKNPR